MWIFFFAKEFRVDKVRKKRIMKRLVYPFALVKPGGIEGDVTLNDINKKILMPPTRPVRHPVGDFACRPTCLSPRGPGLSGKAVVALTRIHTQGRGTITIIRTKGWLYQELMTRVLLYRICIEKKACYCYPFIILYYARAGTDNIYLGCCFYAA